MTYNTDNHSYSVPDKGDNNWHTPYQNAFDELDTDIIIKDVFSNRPADPEADTWFLATDRKILYRYDGTSWDDIAGVGTASDPIPEIHATKTVTDDLEFDAEQPQDVSGSRSDNIWETNNTNYPIAVYVAGASGTTSSGDIAVVVAHVNTSQTNNKISRDKGWTDGTNEAVASLSFVVPPGHDYKVDWIFDGGLDNWEESKLGNPGD